MIQIPVKQRTKYKSIVILCIILLGLFIFCLIVSDGYRACNVVSSYLQNRFEYKYSENIEQDFYERYTMFTEAFYKEQEVVEDKDQAISLIKEHRISSHIIQTKLKIVEYGYNMVKIDAKVEYTMSSENDYMRNGYIFWTFDVRKQRNGSYKIDSISRNIEDTHENHK